MSHSYVDHAFDESHTVTCESETGTGKKKGPRGGVVTPFTVRLHRLLENEEYEQVISWHPHGRSFILRDPEVFANDVMQKHFNQTKLTSFKRQLNLYGFTRISSGPDKGGYYHELCLRGKPHLCTRIIRTRVKGARTKSHVYRSVPNFYEMPALSDSPSQVLQSTKTTLKERCINIKSAGRSSIKLPRSPSSPAHVSPCSSVASDSRPNSPFEPCDQLSLPMGMGERKEYPLFGQQWPSLHDLSSFPDPLTQVDDISLFEGEAFNLLEEEVFEVFDEIINAFDN